MYVIQLPNKTVMIFCYCICSCKFYVFIVSYIGNLIGSHVWDLLICYFVLVFWIDDSHCNCVERSGFFICQSDWCVVLAGTHAYCRNMSAFTFSQVCSFCLLVFCCSDQCSLKHTTAGLLKYFAQISKSYVEILTQCVSDPHLKNIFYRFFIFI